ncbi:MAG TPA: aldo/keto reductase [Steroidobacteraceae bacterium]|nr:aldo/keto reductase [Steroidobacteraceae bacterium]
MPASHQATKSRKFVTRAGRELQFTALGFGSAPLGNYLRPLSEEESDTILAAAWSSGLRYFDTAPLYGLGLSEMRVGRLLKGKQRSDYTLSTKVGRLLEPCAENEVNGVIFVNTPQVRFIYDYSYDAVMRSYEESRKRLGIDRFDILLVHDVDAFCHGSRAASEERIQELISKGGWRALDELRSSGAVAAIGAGVNEWEPCARLLELVDPDLFLLAGRYTLLEQAPLDTLLPQCARRGVGIVIGGPYNSGILAGKPTYNYSTIPPEIVERVRKLDAVCRRHQVPMPAAALQFVLANPLIVSVIPGSQSVAEHEQNFAMLDVSIAPAFWKDLKGQGLLHPDAPVPA